MWWLKNFKLQDVKDTGNSFIVSLDDTKNDMPRTFFIGPLFYNKVKHYILLRPPNAPFDSVGMNEWGVDK